MRNVLKAFGIIVLVTVIGFSFIACDDGDDGGGGDDKGGVTSESVILTMKFEEVKWDNGDGTYGGWDQPGNEDWSRWEYYYQDQNKSYDLADSYTKNKVYVFNYSFSSDVDIDRIYARFVNREPEYKELTEYTEINIPGEIKKNTKFIGRIPLLYRGTDARSCNKDNIYLHIQIKRRDLSTKPTLSFYQFSLEQVAEETYVNESWTVSGKQFKVSDDTRRKYAKNESSFAGKNNVFHIKSTYNASTYDHVVMEYDLSAYAGRKIGIEMSLDAYVKKPSRVAWQINSTEPFYPVIVGNVEEYFFLPANQWNTITGYNIINVPASGDAGKLVYLSGMQINGAEAYFANATFTINENPDDDVEQSVEDYITLEPEPSPNPYRQTARVGGTITINKPSSLPSGTPTWTLNSADTGIVTITPSGNSCSITGVKIGTARITVTAGGQSVIIYIYISPNQNSYTLPSGEVKTFTTWTWDNGVGIIRPNSVDLPTGVTFYYEPTTQLAWYWKNQGGIDFLAYYIDPTNNNRRGWVMTTFYFGGWKYDLNDQRGTMQNGVQTNGNIELKLIPEFVYDKGIPYLQIKHELKNKGSARVTNQKFGASADIMLFDNDSAPLKYMQYGALMTNAVTNPTIKFRLVCQNVQGVDNVSTLWMGPYAGNTYGNYVYVDKREDVTGVDSAMNFSYRNIDLNPNETKTFVVRFTQIQ